MATTSKSNRFWKLSGSLAGLILFVAILVAINILAGQFRLRKDLTQDRLYTLSQGTRQVLSKLDRNVTLMFFFNGSSPEIPAPLKSFAGEVEDLLAEYRMAGAGRVTIERYDPKPDSDAEDLAMRYGVNPQAVSAGGGMLYLGLVAISGDRQAVIPLIDPRTEQLMEYNITRMIYRVTSTRKPTLGILSSLPVMGSQPTPMMPGQRPRQEPPWAAFAELDRDYSVRMLDPQAPAISGEIDTLVVVHPKDLGDKALFAIDQFVLRGGRLLAFVDPFCVSEQENGMSPFGMGAGRSSSLGKLFDTWGVSYDPGKVVADLASMTPLRNQDNTVENNPLYLSLRHTSMSDKDILTSSLDLVLLVMAGGFGSQKADGLALTPLIRTSDQTALTEAMMLQFNPKAYQRDFQVSRKEYNLAIRLEGKFKTAYPDGLPAEAEGTNAPAAPVRGLLESSKPGTVILVADADLLSNDFCVRDIGFFGLQQAINDNMNFFANMVEQMAGSTDLIGIRCRGSSQRPFTRVLALQAEAQKQWMEREQMLEKKLAATQQRMEELQRSKDDKQRFILSPEQNLELEGFRAEVLNYKAELKSVRRSLREGIESLGMKVKLLNILLIPGLVAAIGLVPGLFRKQSTR